jgi:hypothetical protein
VEAICHFLNLYLIVLSFWSVPIYFQSKRGWEGGDLRGVDVNFVQISLKYFEFAS